MKTEEFLSIDVSHGRIVISPPPYTALIHFCQSPSPRVRFKGRIVFSIIIFVSIEHPSLDAIQTFLNKILPLFFVSIEHTSLGWIQGKSLLNKRTVKFLALDTRYKY
jgi:hypothetical protein